MTARTRKGNAAYESEVNGTKLSGVMYIASSLSKRAEELSGNGTVFNEVLSASVRTFSSLIAASSKQKRAMIFVWAAATGHVDLCSWRPSAIDSRIAAFGPGAAALSVKLRGVIGEHRTIRTVACAPARFDCHEVAQVFDRLIACPW